MGSDPLSDVMSLLKPRGYMSGGIDAGGDWSMQFPQNGFFKCFAFVSGQCWLSIDGVDDPIHLVAGDFVVLPHGQAFILASDLTLPPTHIESIVTAPLSGQILRWQGGGACLALSALFTFTGEDSGMLLRVLPPVMHFRNEDDKATMRWYLERMMRSIREPQPGALLLGEHLAQMILIEVLGLYLADKGTDGIGWLFALADPQMGAAITAMHANPGRRWTLHQLAEHVNMSRSAFALRFKQKVGTSAMDYLSRWRMLRAADMLLNSRDPISVIALSLGYESESAFGYAFKREMGCSPRQYGRARSPELASPAPRENPQEPFFPSTQTPPSLMPFSDNF
jgi:AraC-like DNA-binding protein